MRILVLALAFSIAGCYDNVGTRFDDTGTMMLPDGGMQASLAPWETPNMAALPAATATDPCPEMLTQVEIHSWQGGHVADVHAAGCIHAPPAMVWTAIQDPETAHDPGSTDAFSVVRPPMPGECDGPYETQLHATSFSVGVSFRLCWRHAVVMGSDAMPLSTQTRWQKVWGTSAISTLEGSLVSQPHPGAETTITEVYYQYHLSAATTGPSNFQTIHDYLGVIFSRLVMRSHGVML